ncbi:Hypothetical predicted protein, partial [Pelobates cultripes]
CSDAYYVSNVPLPFPSPFLIFVSQYPYFTKNNADPAEETTSSGETHTKPARQEKEFRISGNKYNEESDSTQKFKNLKDHSKFLVHFGGHGAGCVQANLPS